MTLESGATYIPLSARKSASVSAKHRQEHATTDCMIAALHHCRAIAAQLTQAAEIIEAQEKRRQAGLSFSPYEAHKEVLRAAADFDELRTIMEARS